MFVPDALEIGGQRAGPRGGDEQVTAELEVQGFEAGIDGLFLDDAFEARIGGEGGGFGRGGQFDGQAAEQRLVIGDVLRAAVVPCAA